MPCCRWSILPGSIDVYDDLLLTNSNNLLISTLLISLPLQPRFLKRTTINFAFQHLGYSKQGENTH